MTTAPCQPDEDIPRSAHSPKGEEADLRHCVVDKTQMRHIPRHDDELCNVTCHTFLLSSSQPPLLAVHPLAPHPGFGARILRYQVSYPSPFHATYLSRQKNDAKREEIKDSQLKGPGEYPCQLTQLTECNVHITQVTERHPGRRTP